MAYHFLAITSSYSKGYRIGWNYSSEDTLDKAVIKRFLTKMKKRCGDVQFGIHKITTNSLSISSVKEKDMFFEDVVFTSDMDQFISLVASDQKLSALDISKFVLTMLPMSHIKLQKILYYTYAEFLKRTGEKLFKEPIVSYKYGPVVESVFREFTEHGALIIDYEEDENFVIVADDVATTPSFIKVISSEHGSTVIDCVMDTLQRYGDEKPFNLVDKTHRVGGPWQRVYEPSQNNIITDDLILQYHHFVK
ncbi:Panacea domain-containing protein [Virgibacillus sp. Bac330]|uniref:Panacea domain-containing protein n=1 Tax=Virgibacillus sp. Bac330 TaxID=2419841 RepID=UPI000EF46879|nr:type II toxin-antitoxin system antitoxin SocA domain-containing protein [Virgibacillus sp. Bac330]